jgi:nucleotide-binding universal stress UspA family protein
MVLEEVRQMFSSIIVPLDLEPGGDRSLPVAAALAQRAQIPIELVTVSSPAIPEARDLYELNMRSPVDGTATRTVLHDNDPAAALVAFIAERPDALVVMATRARGFVAGQLLGSVSERVLSRTDHPVLLVGPGASISEPSGTPTLVVGVDGTPRSEAVLPTLAQWTESFGGPPPWLIEVLPVPREQQRWDVHETSHLHRLASRLEEQGIEAEWEVAHARHAADALIEFAGQVTDPVLVVASTRWTDPDHRHLTSVARKLAQEARHPVLVVPADRVTNPNSSRPAPSGTR